MFAGKRLKKRREELGLSQAQMADQLGISRPSYFNWEADKTQPNQKNLAKLARLLKVEPAYFSAQYDIVRIYSQLNRDNKEKTLNYSQNLLNQQNKAVQPMENTLYSYKVYEKLSAGTGYSYFGDGNFDTVFYDEEIDHDFAAWIFGDSMEPTFLNGEVALIKQTGFDYDGAIYAVDWNSQTYIKKVYREEKGLRLVSLNKNTPINSHLMRTIRELSG